jgi:hypothetical protein
MLDVLGKRPRRNPERVVLVQDDAPPWRNESWRTDLLPVVVPIGQWSSSVIVAV